MSKYIYFLRPVGKIGPIKIGFSSDPVGRLGSYMAWSPVALEVIVTTPGNRDLERTIHNCFADCHSHCEWFHPHQRLLTAIKDIKAGVPISKAIDLSDKRGNTLSKVQMLTRIKNGTVKNGRGFGINTYQKVMDWLDEAERGSAQ